MKVKVGLGMVNQRRNISADESFARFMKKNAVQRHGTDKSNALDPLSIRVKSIKEKAYST